jgi:hypothetical protein
MNSLHFQGPWLRTLGSAQVEKEDLGVGASYDLIYTEYGGVLHKCLPIPCRQENSAAFSEIAENFLAPKIRDHLGRLPGQEPLKFRGQAP